MKSDSKQLRKNLAIATQQLRLEMIFKKLSELLEENGIEVLLLKGPHLGSTVYDSPKERLYGDLDILVKPSDFSRAAALLLEKGFKPFSFDNFAPEIQRDFKHWEFRSPEGGLVELHRWLSGHDRYPVDTVSLFERAEDFQFGKTHARGLATEDLLLHLCLHMGTSYFHAIERKHVADISLLIKKRKVDWPVFLQHLKKAGASCIAYYALMAVKLQQGTPIPADIMDKLRPGKLRRLWLEKSIDPAAFPIYRFPGHKVKRIKKRLLLPLLDRPGQWVAFFWRIGVTKARMGGRRVREVISRQ